MLPHLAAVLAANRTRDATLGVARPTHVSMGEPARGAFSFPPGSLQLQAMLEAYKRELDAGRPVAMVERQTSTGPVIVDVDLRTDSPTRTYTQAHIEAFLEALVSATAVFVDQRHVTVVVLEKPTPRPVASRPTATTNDAPAAFKDGWHVVMPDVVTHPQVQHAIRDHFVRDVTRDRRYASTLADIPGLVDRDPARVYDRSVIDTGGWFMYGSKKPDEPHAWAVTRWLVFDLVDNCVESQDLADVAPSPADLVERLSIRVAEGVHSPYTPHGAEEVQLAHERNEQAARGGGEGGEEEEEDPLEPGGRTPAVARRYDRGRAGG